LTRFRVDPVAAHQIDEIYDYSRRHWGAEQAEHYVHGLFEHFDAISDRRVTWRPIPAGFGVPGFYSRYVQHFVYWRTRSDGNVAIFSVLHVRMQQAVRLSRAAED
jgi:toxin ParE1/3/4